MPEVNSSHQNTIDKIVTVYFAAVTKIPFTYKNTTYLPRPLIASHLIFRGYTCPAQCGACCLNYSLEYLPNEPHPYSLETYQVEFNGRQIVLAHDQNLDSTKKRGGRTFCRNLKLEDGRCGIHGGQPFSCDFELLRFMYFQKKACWELSTLLFRRKARMMKAFDGSRGTLCEIVPITPDSHADIVRRLERLQNWCEHFGVDSHLPEILTWARSAARVNSLILVPRGMEKMVLSGFDDYREDR